MYIKSEFLPTIDIPSNMPHWKICAMTSETINADNVRWNVFHYYRNTPTTRVDHKELTEEMIKEIQVNFNKESDFESIDTSKFAWNIDWDPINKCWLATRK